MGPADTRRRMPRQRIPPAVAQRFAALLEFFRSESAGGAVLIAAAAAGLTGSNSPAAPSYFRLLKLPIGLSVSGAGFAWPLQIWVNDGLLAFFFLLVPLEIRPEMTECAGASVPR